MAARTKTTRNNAVIRATKLNRHKLGGSAAHTWRTMSVPHADPERTHLNEDWRPASGPDQLRAAIRGRLAFADNVAADSVRAIEYVVTGPHEVFAEQGGPVEWRRYFSDALAFLEARHGAENIVGVNVQLDERTPHLVVYAVPLVDYPATTRTRNVILGKQGGEWVRGPKTFDVPARTALSATHFMGRRDQLRELQTRFAEEVATPHGLRRGLRHSAATHVTTKAYHQALARGLAENLSLSPDDLTRQGLLWGRESPEEHAARVTNFVVEHYAPTVARAATADLDRRRADEMEETARRTEAALEKEREAHRQTRERLTALAGGLSAEEVAKIEGFARKCRRQRREAEEARKREEAQRQEAERKERQRLEDERAARLLRLTPEALARLESGERVRAWRLAVKRDDLEATLGAWAESGLFEVDGTLTPKGRALIEGEAPKAPESGPAREATPAKPWPGMSSRSPFER
ncbi:Plasmid recombination enzyme (plasmid) [Halomonas sp. THAF12]|uniref:MobV family relaxase n=1 Tax=Halomonas sp. THAF12 TaxID=2587849 RepID=UPI0012A8BBAB|nr:MobV family relaxase [Halomonas sp. THAF12]QFT86800.1 Plasmid recombination enzyme [Halomonas sp. THAF12]QFT87043.1 Plasmid recombination enzyme [Halomonas sp. THAF12]